MVLSRLFEDYSPPWALTIRVELPLDEGVDAAETRQRVLDVLQTAGVPSRLANINVSMVSRSCVFEFPVHDWEVGWFVQWMVLLCRSTLGVLPRVVETRPRQIPLSERGASEDT
jgi:hypothetical protein